MNSRQLPLIKEMDVKQATSKSAGKFTGTDNPRHLRTIQSLLISPRKREDIDRIAGAANGPDLIGALRRRGLCIQCRLTPGFDRDGRAIKFGVYVFDDSDLHKIRVWMRTLRAEVN